MSAKLEKLENNIAELKIEVDVAVFEEGMKKSYSKNAGHFNIPGFRKGKAPRKMIEQAYGEGVFYEDAINFVCPDAYDVAITELNIDPVDRPEIDVEQVGNGQNFIFTAKVAVKPEVELGKYKGIEVAKVEYNVTDEEINAEVTKLQERNSRVVTVEDRAVENGDITTIDFEGFKDGVAFEGGTGKDFELTIGSGQFIPGFEEQLIGSSIGDEVLVKVTFPEDYQAEDLKGAPVEFKVKINAIKKKELPALDDEFAKDVSEFDTLQALKDDFKSKLTVQAENRQKSETENSAVEVVVDGAKVEIPECMIETQLNTIMRDYDMRLSQQGLSLEKYMQITGSTIETFKAQFKEQAEKQVKTSLTLEAIGKKEAFIASDEELETEYTTIAENYKMPVEEIKKYIPANDLKEDLITKKVVEFIVENAKIK